MLLLSRSFAAHLVDTLVSEDLVVADVGVALSLHLLGRIVSLGLIGVALVLMSGEGCATPFFHLAYVCTEVLLGKQLTAQNARKPRLPRLYLVLEPVELLSKARFLILLDLLPSHQLLPLFLNELIHAVAELVGLVGPDRLSAHI